MADAIGRYDFSQTSLKPGEVDLYQTGQTNNKREPERRKAVEDAFNLLTEESKQSFEVGLQKNRVMIVMFNPETGEFAAQRLSV